MRQSQLKFGEEALPQSFFVEFEGKKWIKRLILRLVLIWFCLLLLQFLFAVFLNEFFNVLALSGNLLLRDILLILKPGDFGSFHKTGKVRPNILNPHPAYPINFLFINSCSFLLPHPASHEKVRTASMGLELNENLGVDSVMDIKASFFLDLTSSTGLCSFMLVPLPLGEAKLVAHSHYQDFRVVLIENNSSTDGLVFLQSSSQLKGINSDKLWTILFEFEEEFISLAIAVLDFLLTQDNIDIVIEGLFRMVAEPAAVPLLFLGQVDHKFAKHAFEEFSLPLHQQLQEVESRGRSVYYMLDGRGFGSYNQSIINGRQKQLHQAAPSQTGLLARPQQIRGQEAEDQAQRWARD